MEMKAIKGDDQKFICLMKVFLDLSVKSINIPIPYDDSYLLALEFLTTLLCRLLLNLELFGTELLESFGAKFSSFSFRSVIGENEPSGFSIT